MTEAYGSGMAMVSSINTDLILRWKLFIVNMSRYVSQQDSSSLLSSIVIVGILYMFYSNLASLNAWINGHTTWIRNFFFLALAVSFIYPFQVRGATYSGPSSAGSNWSNVPQLMRSMILSDQGGRCGRCRGRLDRNYYIDLIVPVYRGGMQQSMNYQALCGVCHRNREIEQVIERRVEMI